MAETGVSNADLLDLTNTTLPKLPNLDFEVAQKYQEYPVVNQWFKGDKIQVDSGTSIEKNIVLDTSGNARHVRLYQKTAINVADIHHKIKAPWCQVQTHWSIERRELLRNRAPSRYINLLQSRRLDGMLDLADLLEDRAWATPSNENDDLNPRGLPYWLSGLDDAATTAGFLAYKVRWSDGVTAASNTKGGIDGSAAANARWKGYAFQYTSIDAAFVQALRRAFHATNFRSPMMVKDLVEGPTSSFRLYFALDELCAYEDLVTQSNDNLGSDLDKFHGITTFRRVPIIYTPQLDALKAYGDSGTENDYNPIFGVNHRHFYPMVLDGDWLREEPAMSDVEQHNVQTAFMDGSYQYFCDNVRQAGFCGHNTIAA